jgi:predicted MFS family arabinose efflux permease
MHIDDAGGRASRRTTAGAAASVVLSGLPPFLTGSLMPLMRDELALDTDRLGMIVAVYFVCGALSAMPAGRQVERLGARRGILVANGMTAASLLTVGLFGRSWIHLAMAVAVAGGANGMLHPATNLAIVRGVLPGRQGIAFGIKQAAAPTATLIAGSAVSAMAGTAGWRWAFLGAALLFPLVAAVLPRRSAADPPAHRPTPADPNRVLIRLAIAAALGFGAATTLGAFLADAVVNAGGRAATAGYALIAASVASIAVRLATGWYTDRTASPSLGLVAGLLATGSIGFVVLALGSGPWAWGAGAILALGAGWGWPGLLYHVVSAANAEAPAAATAFTTVGNTAGGALGPFAFGLIARHVSFAAAWGMSAALALAAALMLVLLQGRADWTGTSAPPTTA